MLVPPLSAELTRLPADRPVDFEWDEWQFQGYFYYCVTGELERLQALTHKANIALALAVCEWVEERFRPFSDDPTLLLYIAAGWAALIDRHYSERFRLVDDQWIGPVRAPMMAAMGIINEAFYEADSNPDMAYRACYAINLARHVMPAPEPFEAWLEASIRRLERFHSWTAEGPVVEDLFAEEFHQGNLVAREVFDPTRPYDPADAARLLHEFVRRQDRSNPFLHLPSDF